MNDEAWIDVDLEALRRNVAVVRERVAPARVMAVLKNDAYAHGLLPVARAAVEAGADALGALDVATAWRLVEAGLRVPVFTWLLGPEDDLAAAASAGIELGVSTAGQLERAAETATPPARVHLKVDTGLNRNGVRAEDWRAVVGRAAELERAGAIEVVGVLTHISEASYDEDSAAIARFEDAVRVATDAGLRPRVRHLAASAAAFARPDARFDLVRVGAFCYGISPGDGILPASLDIEPILALRARVVRTGEEDGEAVAEVAVGSGAGLLDMPCDALTVEARGIRHPIARIALTHTVIRTATLEVGDVVTLIGSDRRGEPTTQEWADALGTIGEEIVTRLSPRLPRRYG